jgi:DNA polymerase III epsilon subunit-like protein
MKFKAIIFDTETTGLLMPSSAPVEKQPQIIELGALAVDRSGIVGELSQLLDPGVPVPWEITKITGLKTSDVAGKPSFKTFLPSLIRFFAGSTLLIAHNAPFDSGMLRLELLRASCTDFPFPGEVVCTAAEYAPGMGWRASVKDVYLKILGRELEQKHRALDDCKALYEIILKDKFFEKIGVL